MSHRDGFVQYCTVRVYSQLICSLLCSISVVASTGALSVASWAQVKVSAFGYYFDALNTPYVRGVVLATDAHGLVAEASLTIAVLDVSDPPQFQLTTYAASVLACLA